MARQFPFNVGTHPQAPLYPSGSGGSAGVGGGGTIGKIPIWSGPTTLDDSSISEDVGVVTVAARLSVEGEADANDFVLIGGSAGGGTPDVLLAVLDEGSTVASSVRSINFTGAGVEATAVDGDVVVAITFDQAAADARYVQLANLNALGDARWLRIGGSGQSVVNLALAGDANPYIRFSDGTYTALWQMSGGDMRLNHNGTLRILAMHSGGQQNYGQLQIIKSDGSENIATFDESLITFGMALESTSGAAFAGEVDASDFVLIGGEAGGSASAALFSVLDEGVLKANNVTSINFVGGGVVASAIGSDITVEIVFDQAAADARYLRLVGGTLTGTLFTSDNGLRLGTSGFGLFNSGEYSYLADGATGRGISVNRTTWETTVSDSLAVGAKLTAAGIVRSTSAYGWAIGSLAGIQRAEYNAGVFSFITEAEEYATVAAVAFQIGTTPFAQATAAQHLLLGRDGNIAIRLGGSDQTSYYDNTQHIVRMRDGSVVLSLTDVEHVSYRQMAFSQDGLGAYCRPATAGAASYFGFYDSTTAARRAYVGLFVDSGATADFYINSDSGRVMIRANGGLPIIHFGTAGIVASYNHTAPDFILS